MPNQDHEDLKQLANKRTDADRRRSRESSITFTYDLGTGEVDKTFLASIIKIGKLSSSALYLDDSTVSRMHAYVERYGDDEYFISDLGSACGTFIDGQRVNKAKLRTGEVLRIGEVELRVQVGNAVERLEPKSKSLPQRVFGVLTDLAAAVSDDLDKVYYCETCLTLHGNVVVMQKSEGVAAYVCPACQGSWKLNRGQARHTVSLKLQHYQQLADKLGIK